MPGAGVTPRRLRTLGAGVNRYSPPRTRGRRGRMQHEARASAETSVSGVAAISPAAPVGATTLARTALPRLPISTEPGQPRVDWRILQISSWPGATRMVEASKAATKVEARQARRAAVASPRCLATWPPSGGVGRLVAVVSRPGTSLRSNLARSFLGLSAGVALDHCDVAC